MGKLWHPAWRNRRNCRAHSQPLGPSPQAMSGFILTDVNQSDWNGQTVLLVDTVEGNTQGQFIKVNSRRASEIIAYYQIRR